MTKDRLIGAASRCYRYASGLLLGQGSASVVNADLGSGRRGGSGRANVVSGVVHIQKGSRSNLRRWLVANDPGTFQPTALQAGPANCCNILQSERRQCLVYAALRPAEYQSVRRDHADHAVGSGPGSVHDFLGPGNRHFRGAVSGATSLGNQS